jgi:hypothetical protein
LFKRNTPMNMTSPYMANQPMPMNQFGPTTVPQQGFNPNLPGSQQFQAPMTLPYGPYETTPSAPTGPVYGGMTPQMPTQDYDFDEDMDFGPSPMMGQQQPPMGYGQGMPQGPGMGFNPGMTQAPGTGFGPGMAHAQDMAYGPGMTQAPGMGFTPGMHPTHGMGFNPGMAQAPGMGFGPGMSPNPGMGYGPTGSCGCGCGR